MLAQTTVAAVVPYFRRWMKQYPNVRRLARAPLRKVLKSWQGLGYYQRARNLHRAARLIVQEHCGQVPQDYSTLRRIPGFGAYTAAAVLSLAYGQPYPVVEANVRRVVARLFGLDKPHGPRLELETRNDLRSLFSRRNPGLFNQALMELGALVCRPRQPLCLACPVRSFCLAYQRGEQEVIPRPGKRSVQKIEAVIAVIRRRGRYLIQKRPDRGLMAGLWEFPGGKIEPGESREKALRRELREELGLEIERARFLLTVHHAYTEFRVRLHAFAVTLRHAPRLRDRNRRWVSLAGLRHYPFPSGSAKVVDFLEKPSKIED